MRISKSLTSFLVSKNLPKEAFEKTLDRILKPLYNYTGGCPPENIKELSYGLYQMKEHLIPKSLAYFENPNKIGYYERAHIDEVGSYHYQRTMSFPYIEHKNKNRHAYIWFTQTPHTCECIL